MSTVSGATAQFVFFLPSQWVLKEQILSFQSRTHNIKVMPYNLGEMNKGLLTGKRTKSQKNDRKT